jgi:5-(carboxyamino)imidazole ribonucleotide synthase
MRVGILGGGQLGWMTILEGRKLGFEFFVADDMPRSPARKVADLCFDYGQIDEFVRLCDVITYEFEHIPEEVRGDFEAKKEQGGRKALSEKKGLSRPYLYRSLQG